MKKLSALLLMAMAISSCKKESISDLREEVSGTWEFIQSSSFMGAPVIYPPGNGRIIYLGKNGTFETRSFDTVLTRTTFFLKKKKDCYMDGKFVFINTDDRQYSDDHIKIEVINDTLYFNTSSCLIDGGGGSYRRIL